MRAPAVLAALAALALVSGAPAASARWRLVASGERYALYSRVSLDGEASRPQAVALRAVSAPPQAVSVKWSLRCTAGGGARATSGSYTARTAALQRLRLPLPRPRSCVISASGRLVGGGTLTMKIYSLQ